MILSVCIALFIINRSQSDLLSFPLKAAETQALVASSSSKAATTLFIGERKGELGSRKSHPWFLRASQTSTDVGFLVLPQRSVY